MDLFPWVMGTVIATLVVVFAILIPIAIHNDNKFKDACHAKAGNVISTRSRLYCVKPDAFIDVNTN